MSHFYYKSAIEFLERRIKNRGDEPALTGENFVPLSEHNMADFLRAFPAAESQQTGAQSMLPKRFEQCRRHLMETPGVKSAYEQIIRFYQDRFARLEKALADGAPLLESGESAEAFRALIVAA